jgi:hypothetical protein
MAGLLTFLDPPRPDTKETIETAMKYGVGVSASECKEGPCASRHSMEGGTPMQIQRGHQSDAASPSSPR